MVESISSPPSTARSASDTTPQVASTSTEGGEPDRRATLASSQSRSSTPYSSAPQARSKLGAQHATKLPWYDDGEKWLRFIHVTGVFLARL